MKDNKQHSNSRRQFLRQASALIVTGAAGLSGWEKIAQAAAILDQNQAFTLVQNGAPVAVILTPENPTKNNIAATNDLNYWIKRISGTTLKVLPASQWDQKMPAIAVGKSTFTHEHGITEESLAQEISKDGAKIIISKNHILLTGRERDDYAVSEFVRYALNVRWIWPGESGEVFEPRETLSVSQQQWTWDTPMHEIRVLNSTYHYHSTPFARKELEEQLGMDYAEEVWSGAYATALEETDAWLHQMRADVKRIVVGQNAFTSWWDKYGADHPDWFAQPPVGIIQKGGRGVKLNVSNPAVAATILGEWQKTKGDFLNITPNDGRGYCTCFTCRSWDAPAMQQLTDAEIYSSDKAILTDRYLRFWNSLAEKAAVHNPNVQLTTYAYRSMQLPPLTDIKVNPHLLIGYVGGEGYYPEEPIRLEWAGWAAAGTRLFWRPNLLHCGHSMPYLFPKNLGDDLHYFMQHNMRGFNFDAITCHWATQGLNYYMAAEALLRPNADIAEIENEYYAAFGKAAEPVKKYFYYWQELTKKGPATLRNNKLVNRETWGGWWEGFFKLTPILYNDQAFEDTKVLLQQAEQLAKTDQPIIAERVQFLRIGWEHSRMTAQAIDATLKAVRNPDNNPLKQTATQKRNALMAFRKSTFKQHPLAINITEITRIERNQKIMW